MLCKKLNIFLSISFKYISEGHVSVSALTLGDHHSSNRTRWRIDIQAAFSMHLSLDI